MVDSSENHGSNNLRKALSFRLLLTLAVIGALIPIVALASFYLYERYFEITNPVIIRTDFSRGIGIAPVSFKFNIKDKSSGLSEIIARVIQKNEKTREILRHTLKEEKSQDISLDFPGIDSGLYEGIATIEIEAKDASFWQNKGILTITTRVDFQKPTVELLSSEQSIPEGSTQLVFLRIYEDDLGISGIRIGSKVFPAYPARGLDKSFQEKSLYVVLYSAPFEDDSDAKAMRIFAEDQTGNVASIPLSGKILRNTYKTITNNLSSPFLYETTAKIYDNNFQRLMPAQPDFGAEEKALAKLQQINTRLRQLNNEELATAVTKGGKLERIWDGPFLSPSGDKIVNFGDLVIYSMNGKAVTTWRSTGCEFGTRRREEDVFAANDGFVTVIQDIGVYGSVLAIDHGLGLVSIYGNLGQTFVKRGERVGRNQKIGTTNQSAFAPAGNLIFEMRLNGIPLNASYWWESNWYHQEIVKKIERMKKDLGLEVLRPIR